MDLFPNLLDSKIMADDDDESWRGSVDADEIDPWLQSLRSDDDLDLLIEPGVVAGRVIRQQDIEFCENSDVTAGCSDNNSDRSGDDGSRSPSLPSVCDLPLRNTAPGSNRRRGTSNTKKRAEDKGLTRNAIAARENRIKKKEYVKGLECSVRHLAGENRRLTTLSDDLRDRTDSLTSEVAYLRGVLANVDEIATLVRSVRGGAPDLALGCNVTGQAAVKREPGAVPKVKSSSGVCLHVNNKKVSLEFCPRCSASATSAWKQLAN